MDLVRRCRDDYERAPYVTEMYGAFLLQKERPFPDVAIGTAWEGLAQI